ncbi:hypothetical protein CN374_16150 [Bacillus cereus]|nr:hypothetical protein CN374_16150 [Bacillus cereus]
MAFLIRKMARSKWPQENFMEMDINDLSADAITSCLRTSSNTLSTWEIESMENLEDAVLALVAASQKIDTMFVVSIDKEKIINNGFQIEETPGQTLVEDLIETHKDVSGLTYQTIGKFASVMLESLHEEQVHRFTASKLKKILISAIESGRLDKEALNEDMRKKLKLSA